MSLFWTHKAWSRKHPSIEGDEYGRHVLVVPNPFVVSDVYEGTDYHPAAAVVVAPWWFCRHIFSAEYRKETKQMRKDSREAESEVYSE